MTNSKFNSSNFEVNIGNAESVAGQVTGDQVNAETYIQQTSNSNYIQNVEVNGSRGGHGGGGNAIGKWSKVIGGKGGVGANKGCGCGGDGGGGDAVGDHSMVIGGDGGDAARSDGRGGRGGISPLKKLSKDTLQAFGLSGYEGYGQGGNGQNSIQYDRALRVLCQISAEYLEINPDVPMYQMPGVLMPPVEWVNSSLEKRCETFRIKFIDNDTDFFIQDSNN